MINPLYPASLIIGGSTTTYNAPKVLGVRIHADQSFDLQYTLLKEDGTTAYDIDSATSTLRVTAYKGSGYESVLLVSGVHSDSGSGTVDRVTFTVPANAIPEDIAKFPLRNPGNAIFYAIITDGAGKLIEIVAEVNIFDTDYSLTGEAAPSDRVIIPKGNDLGTVESLIVSTPPTPTLNIAYIVGPSGTGDWVGQDDNLAIGTGTAWVFLTPVEGNFVYDKATDTQYVFDTAWTVAVSLPVPDTTSIVKDPGDNTKQMRIDVGAVSTATTRVLTMPDTNIDLDDIGTNSAKVTNATHTGDVAGATALTLQNAAISGKSTVTAVGADFVLIGDTSDSGNLKKALVSDFGGGGAGIAANWTFSTSITASDPGAAGIRYNNATPASVTAIYLNVASNNTADFETLISALGSGDTLYLQQLDDDADFILFNVTSIVDNTGWYTINGTIADSGTLPANSSDIGVAFEYTGAGAGASVTSVFGRAGAVVAVSGDYEASEITDLQKDVAAGTDNNQVGTSYTIVLTDQENKTVWMSNASSNTLTIPTNASVAFPTGTKINVMMEGAGVTTIAAVSGSVTVNGATNGSVVINNQYQGATLTKRSANVWIITGDIT